MSDYRKNNNKITFIYNYNTLDIQYKQKLVCLIFQKSAYFHRYSTLGRAQCTLSADP